MQLSKQEAADFCRELGFEELEIDQTDPDFKLLSAIEQLGLGKLAPCTLEAILRLTPERLQLGELHVPESKEGKQRLKQLLSVLRKPGGWFHVLVPMPTENRTQREIEPDHDYEKLCEKLRSVDPQSDDWERIAGLPGLQINRETVLFSSGATCDAIERDGKVARRLPPADPRVRAHRVLEYWELRAKRAEQALKELQHKHLRRTTAPSPQHFPEAKQVREEVKLCRKELADARERAEAPNRPRQRTYAEIEMDAAIQQETREQISQMEELLNI